MPPMFPRPAAPRLRVTWLPRRQLGRCNRTISAARRATSASPACASARRRWAARSSSTRWMGARAPSSRRAFPSPPACRPYATPLCQAKGAIPVTHTATLDLFAGVPVADFAAARTWYETLLGSPPAFLPHDSEAVWELAEHRYLYIVEQPEHAGHARHTLFVADFDALIARIAAQGLVPVARETYANGVRKA